MSLDEIVEQLMLERLTPDLCPRECRQVRMVHVAESLSEVLSQAEHGGVLLTSQADMRILAAAVLKQVIAVVFSSKTRPNARMVQEAVEAGIPLYATNETLFTVAGRLYGLGLRGCHA